jgi:hypothetical protein
MPDTPERLAERLAIEGQRPLISSETHRRTVECGHLYRRHHLTVHEILAHFVSAEIGNLGVIKILWIVDRDHWKTH